MKIVATYVSASSQGQRKHSARTKIPKIVATFVYARSQGQRTHSARTKMTYLYLAIYFFVFIDTIVPQPYLCGLSCLQHCPGLAEMSPLQRAK